MMRLVSHPIKAQRFLKETSLNATLPDGWLGNSYGQVWKARVQKLANWYQRKKSWPGGISMKDGKKRPANELSPEDQEKAMLHKFLAYLCRGTNDFLDGETDPKKLNGMNQDRLNYLNDTLPEGWNVARKRKRDQQE